MVFHFSLDVHGGARGHYNIRHIRCYYFMRTIMLQHVHMQ
jgi:hypothetical protein